jgi:hypothetical protein
MNLSGWMVLSCILFKGKRYIKGWFKEYGLPPNWRIKISANSWTMDKIGLLWLEKSFIPTTTSQKIGQY